ncbi:MAG: glycerate kinase, partial [Actinomycetota bacterium]|nr:glycerate kinase [Actinomycetota bacterium]
MPRVVAATGGFRGAATASEAALAVARGATVAGWACEQVPLSDGGEGFAEVFGGRARLSVVGGPLGLPLEVEWRLSGDGRTAAVESSLASGLDLVGGPEGNDAVRAGSGGTGQLVAAAVRAGARRVLVGVGPSASTDGGLGALEALEPHSRMHGVELVVGCDAMVGFVDSARLLAPDKGASPSEVALLSRRLERLVQLYRERFGVDVSVIGGAGAGGGQ